MDNINRVYFNSNGGIACMRMSRLRSPNISIIVNIERTCHEYKLVSTSIPYVNAHPHIGFALELVQADVIARWRRLFGHRTFFLTGTDENALKNVLVARQLNITPQKLCDRNALIFEKLKEALWISADQFVRTSQRVHQKGAAAFWSACRKEDIVLKSYKGYYCLGCEDFYLKRDLEEGQCPIHGVEPDLVEEQNYFFRLSAYQEKLEALIESKQLCILPETRRNEALGFIRQGLRDFSISRPRHRSAGWGVPVPGDPSQILYVWFDALTNYLTGLGYGESAVFKNPFWTEGSSKVHVIGKDILKFHAVYWPAMLLSAGLPLPNMLVVHGHLTVDGQKIGKSSGNAVDPFPLIERFGADALRYYLLRAIAFGSDGDYSSRQFNSVYNADLANGLGNLVSRLETLCERAEFTSACSLDPGLPRWLTRDGDVIQFHIQLRKIWDEIRRLNQDIEAKRPWDLLKSNNNGSLEIHLTEWVNAIRDIGLGLAPFLPEASAEVLKRFSGQRIKRGNPLFPRIKT